MDVGVLSKQILGFQIVKVSPVDQNHSVNTHEEGAWWRNCGTYIPWNFSMGVYAASSDAHVTWDTIADQF